MTELETLTIIVKERGCGSISCKTCYYYSPIEDKIIHNCILLENEDNLVRAFKPYHYIFRKAKIRLKEIKLEKIAND
jgi:hypothetical protein